jgi:hypothetical protein
MLLSLEAGLRPGLDVGTLSGSGQTELFDVHLSCGGPQVS